MRYQMMVRRTYFQLFVGVALVLGLLFGTGSGSAAAAPAARLIDGCTAAPYGYVCVQVDGTAGTTYVARANVVRGKGDASMICNYGGRVSIISPSGQVLWTKAENHSGCSVGRAWFNFAVNKYFPAGSKVCSRFREDGVQQGGEPCLTLSGKTHS